MVCVCTREIDKLSKGIHLMAQWFLTTLFFPVQNNRKNIDNLRSRQFIITFFFKFAFFLDKYAGLVYYQVV